MIASEQNITHERDPWEVYVDATAQPTSSSEIAQQLPDERPSEIIACPIIEPTKSIGDKLFESINAFLKRFIAYPSEDACVAHTLWIAHTHLMASAESTPRLAFLSPEPSSGKTRALEVTETLVPRPVEAMNATSAYIFRKISDPKGPPTILFDEIDTIFGPKAKQHEELRGVINAGHRRGAMAGRCVMRGNAFETEELPAYCAVALAGLGKLPDTILTRSIVIHMRRRAATEHVEPYRRIYAPIGNLLREELAAWADQIHPTLNTSPDMPPGIEDRDADVWEPLFSIADAAGGDWPRRVRVAAVALVALAKATPLSLGLRLLRDLKDIFGGNENLSTDVILKKLCAITDAPWGNLRGKPIDSRILGKLLSQYDVQSKDIRINDKVLKGYTRDDLHDPWNRYLKNEVVTASGTSATSATSATNATTIPRNAVEVEI